MLELTHVTKTFNDVKAVDDISLSINRGQVVGLLGPNGAGKTTTMRMIATVLEPDSGSIQVFGASTVTDSLSIRRRLGFLPENNPLYGDMMVSEYLDFVGRTKGVKGRALERSVREAVEETRLTSVYFTPIEELSKGFKQRVGLAQAILHKPDLLILDEPTEGLDPNQRVEIRELIKALGKERTVLLSTHVLQEVSLTCNRVIIINHGKVIADGSTEELIQKSTAATTTVVEGAGIDPKKIEGVAGVAGVTVHQQPNNMLHIEIASAADIDIRPLIFELALAEHWKLSELHQQSQSLEDVFRNLTEKP